MRTKYLLGAAGLLGVASMPIPVSAQGAEPKFETVQDLYRMCTGGGFERFGCLGFISGANGEMSLFGALADSLRDPRDRVLVKEQSVCGNGTNGAAVQAFKKLGRKTPGDVEQATSDGHHPCLARNVAVQVTV
jgi:hypothetical protein